MSKFFFINAGVQLWAPGIDVIQTGLYLDAKQRVTLVNNAVSQWNDTGNNWFFAQSNASLRPQYSPTGWNGTPAINPISNTQRLLGTINFTPLIGSNGFTAFTSIRQTGQTGWIWQIGNQSPGARAGMVIISNQLYGVINSESTIGNMPAGNNIAVFIFNGSASTKSRLRLNGSNLASGGISATSTTTNAGALAIGNGVDINAFTGFMRDLIILPYAASDLLIQKIEGFLAWKDGQLVSGLSSSHPFVNRPPYVSD